MRQVRLYLLLALLFITGCQGDDPVSHVRDPDKYVPRSARKKEKYATPEPGTYLKPVAYALLREMNRIMEDPESFQEPGEWVIKILAPSLKKVTDTVIRHLGCVVPVRIYYPTRRSLKGEEPVSLYFHGGGFVSGNVEQYDIMVSKLARIIGRIVVSVEYRLAPEHPFPAGVNDCYAVLRWMQQHASEIGGDLERISVMGDSAGGNIAAVLTLMCRDRNIAQPCCQVLLYPGTTFSDTLFQSRIYFGLEADKRYVLDESFLRRVKREYMGNMADDRHPYLSPLEADLTSDLAPALVITAECDPLRDGGRAYAKKLAEAGVEVEHIEYSGMIHGFISFHMVLSDALHAMKYIRSYLDRI